MKKLLSILLITHCSLVIVHAQTGWVQQNSGTFCNLNSVFFVDANTGYVVGDSANSRGVILKTSDGGSNWIRQLTIGSGISSVFFIDANTGFACGGNLLHVYCKTTNGGSNWSTAVIFDSTYMYSIYFLNNLSGIQAGIYAHIGDGAIVTAACIYRTTDGGVNWARNIMGIYPGGLQSVYFVDVNTGYACGDSEILKTTNSGVNWSQLPAPALGTIYYSVQFLNGTTGWTVSSNKIYKTTNGGSNWPLLYSQSLCSNLYSLNFVNEQTGWICGCQGVINATTNGGINWTLQSSGTTTNLRSLNFVDALTGWAAGDLGRILKTTNGGFTSVHPTSNEIPEKFALFQNYPNPFNPETKIKFDIPSLIRRGAGVVVLKIYDILGRVVTTLVHEQLKPGTYEIEFDGSQFASGIYYYELVAGSFTESKGMVLLK